MEEREGKLAQWRQEIERRHAVWLLKRREQIRPIDWADPPDLEDEAVRKLRDQNRKKLERQFSPEAFLRCLVPSLCEFASYVAIFERTVLATLPPSERHAHSERAVTRILELILGRAPSRKPMPPEVRYVRTSEEKIWAGKTIAAPFEILLDEHRRAVGYRPVERCGEFEHLPIGKLWGLLRAPGMKRQRLLLRRMIQARLRSDFVQMATDRRSREQMVEDCKQRHAGYDDGRGIEDKNIACAARVSPGDFYRWRKGNLLIGAIKHRRILFVICSPVWPPPQI